MKKKILIYDDEEAFQDNLKNRLSFLDTTVFDIITPSEGDFLEWMKVLDSRRRAFRESGTWEGESILLDEASILVVDYDLFDAISFLTGEDVAYLARCFSKCGLIVGVNQYGHNPFDLTLKGHPESYADLNVGQEQLGNPNLWGEDVDGFHPWSWPVLPNYLDAFEKKIEDVEESLRDDVPICAVIGFPTNVFDLLPRSIGQFIGEKPSRTGFREFVVKFGNGLRLKDAQVKRVSDAVVARVGAARISKWLERLVLPGQDILVDAPHLVSRYPSLLGEDVEDIETWNGTARLTSYRELGLTTEIIERFRLKKDYWLSRPVWFWDELRECEEIKEVKEPWTIERPGWVFCEDASRFYEKYTEFVADVESPFVRRFLSRFEGVDYQPAYRFSL
ncbi:hypothetical protein DRJ25_04105 [Candidatus Woesearchaeota archaeon]|nr:MAG: hypothetical protein DRJ25_04105 [Candidatus Woesearchaeota archaeon]